MTFKYYSSDLDKCALNLPLLLLSSTSVQSNFFRFLSTDCTPCGHMLSFWLIAVWESPCCCKNLLVCSCKLWRTLKDLQKAWKSVAQDHFLKITRKPGSLEAKYDEMKGGTRLLDYLDFFVHWFVFMDTHIIIWWQLVKPWLKFIQAVCEIVPMFIHLCSQRGTVVLPVNSPQKRTSRMWWWRLRVAQTTPVQVSWYQCFYTFSGFIFTCSILVCCLCSVAICSGLGTTTTWLGLNKDHCLVSVNSQLDSC